MSEEEWELEHKKDEAAQAAIDEFDKDADWLKELEAELQKLPAATAPSQKKVLVIQVPTSPKIEKEEAPADIRERIAKRIRGLLSSGRVRRKEELWNLMAEQGFDSTIREVLGRYAQLLDVEAAAPTIPERAEAQSSTGYASTGSSGYGSWNAENARERADMQELTRQTGAVAPNPASTGAADVDAVKALRSMTGEGFYRENFSEKKAEEKSAYTGWG